MFLKRLCQQWLNGGVAVDFDAGPLFREIDIARRLPGLDLTETTDGKSPLHSGTARKVAQSQEIAIAAST